MNQYQHDKDFSLQAVPAGNRRGFFSMFTVMLGFTFFSASMWGGGTLGTALRFQDFLLAVLLGNLILGIYTSLLAYMGSETALSTHILSRYSFGEKGSYLASFILSITQIGWFGVGVAMFALPVHHLTGIHLHLLILGAGLLMTGSAYFGMRALTVLSLISVPLISILGGTSMFRAVETAGGIGSLFLIEPTAALPMTLTAALSVCVGSFISGGTLTPDFIRFSKNKRVGVSTTLIAFFLGNSLMFLFGAVGAMVVGQSDISEVMLSQGLLVPAILVLGLNIWTTNDNAIYASGLGFSNITKLPKSRLVLINGLIGTLGALFLYNNFVGWLNFLNSIIPPIGAVLIADFFLVNRAKYRALGEAALVSVNPHAIAAWVLGVLASRLIPGIPPVNGVVAAILTYVVLTRVFAPAVEVAPPMKKVAGAPYVD